MTGGLHHAITAIIGQAGLAILVPSSPVSRSRGARTSSRLRHFRCKEREAETGLFLRWGWREERLAGQMVALVFPRASDHPTRVKIQRMQVWLRSAGSRFGAI